eukprot:916609-Rhodomonas_salina.3
MCGLGALWLARRVVGDQQFLLRDCDGALAGARKSAEGNAAAPRRALLARGHRHRPQSGFGARGCFWRDGVGTRTLRCLCVLRGHTERRRRALSVRSLAATGADMNAVDVLNQTVLHFLVKNRR